MRINRKFIAALWGFWIALTVSIYFGYTVGKDLALRDNAREARAGDGR